MTVNIAASPCMLIKSVCHLEAELFGDPYGRMLIHLNNCLDAAEVHIPSSRALRVIEKTRVVRPGVLLRCECPFVLISVVYVRCN